MTRFVLGGILVIFGLTLFLLGVDIGILPIGERSGAALTARRSLKLLLAAAFLIGFIVTVAEPDVQVLADQVRGIAPSVSKWGLILMIAVGVGLFVALGILRTVLSIPLNILLTVSYIGVFALAFCASSLPFLSFAKPFDAMTPLFKYVVSLIMSTYLNKCLLYCIYCNKIIS
jgi:hypothetical protein